MHPLAPYLPPEALEKAVDRLAAAAGGAVRELGRSVDGRPIRAVVVPCSGRADPPRVIVCAGIHGVEYIGVHVALSMLDALGRGDLASLRSRAEVWVIPTINPDGYARTWACDGVGVLAELRTNARGVDLNRNYPLPAAQRRVLFDFGGWRTGSDDPHNAFFRGTGPLSEPETAAVAGLLDVVPFRASVNLHSTMGTLIPPHVQRREDATAYRALCHAFRRGQRRARYRRVAGPPSLDRFTGEQEDYQHHVHKTWALCVEHYPVWVQPARFLRAQPMFWRFNPRRPQRWIDNDLPGIVSFLDAALERPPPT